MHSNEDPAQPDINNTIKKTLNIQKTMIMASGFITTNRWGNNGNNDRLLFWGTPESLQMVTAALKLKDAPWKKSYDQPR